MNQVIFLLLISLKLVSVPHLTGRNGDFIHYKKIVHAFRLKYSVRGGEVRIYRIRISRNGFVYLDGRKMPFRSRKAYIEANDWAYLLSRVLRSKNLYWEASRKKFIVSGYPPSVKLKKKKDYHQLVEFEFYHNRDIKPRIERRGDTLKVHFSRGFMVSYPDKFKNTLCSAVRFRHTLSGLKLTFYLKQNVKVVYRIGQRYTRLKFYIREKRRVKPVDLIVIDPGHGGKDPGAIGYGGIREKYITLAIAKEVKRIARRKLGVRVVLTRERDVFIPLWKRSEMANRLGASLFISIHCNFSRNKSARGVETYFLSSARTKWERAVAALENASVKYEINNHKQYDMVKRILGDLAQNQYLKESQILARFVHESIVKKTGSRNRGIKQAGFYVLFFTHTPSILVETGFISNRYEARRLKSRWYIRKIAEGIVDGIALYYSKYAEKQ